MPTKVASKVLGLATIALVACREGEAPRPTTGATASSTSAASGPVATTLPVASSRPSPTPSPSASAPAEPAPPALDLACARDADCELSARATGGASVCCHECTFHAASKTSLARFETFCEERQERLTCRPLSCKAPGPMKPVCRAGRCAVEGGP